MTAKLEWNVMVLGRSFFDQSPYDQRALSLLIHEMGHQRCGDHFSHRYLDALTDIGAEIAFLALTEPDFFG